MITVCQSRVHIAAEIMYHLQEIRVDKLCDDSHRLTFFLQNYNYTAKVTLENLQLLLLKNVVPPFLTFLLLHLTTNNIHGHTR